MPRFAIHKQQILSEDELNNTTYYLRLEIEEAKVLRSWKIHQSIPSEPGYQSKAVMYQQDLPLVYLYIEKSPEEEDYSNTYELDAAANSFYCSSNNAIKTTQSSSNSSYNSSRFSQNDQTYASNTNRRTI